MQYSSKRVTNERKATSELPHSGTTLTLECSVCGQVFFLSPLPACSFLLRFQVKQRRRRKCQTLSERQHPDSVGARLAYECAALNWPAHARPPKPTNKELALHNQRDDDDLGSAAQREFRTILRPRSRTESTFGDNKQDSAQEAHQPRK